MYRESSRNKEKAKGVQEWKPMRGYTPPPPLPPSAGRTCECRAENLDLIQGAFRQGSWKLMVNVWCSGYYSFDLNIVEVSNVFSFFRSVFFFFVMLFFSLFYSIFSVF